jgi:membrane associated rhomboid family serine protease
VKLRRGKLGMRFRPKRIGPAIALGGIGAILGAALGALMGGPEVGFPATIIGAIGGAVGGMIVATWFRAVP